MKKMMMGLMLVTCLAAYAGAEVLYQNDFGAATGYADSGLSWVSANGSGVGGLILETGPTPPGDLNGDGLYKAFVMDTGFGGAYGIKTIYAPVFKSLSNISVSGYGQGFSSSWVTGACWGLTLDGATYDYWLGSDNSNTWKQYSISAAGDPAYTGISKFTAATYVYSGSGTYNPGASGRTAAFVVAADTADGKVGDRVNLSLNDFGTAAQQSEWTISGSNLQIVNDPTQDRSNDNLGGYLISASAGNCSAILKIDAPAGFAFKNVIATGSGYGSWNNWGSRAMLLLSNDGSNWLCVSMSSWASGYLPQATLSGITAELVTVPEPITMSLLGLGGLALLKKRH